MVDLHATSKTILCCIYKLKFEVKPVNLKNGDIFTVLKKTVFDNGPVRKIVMMMMMVVRDENAGCVHGNYGDDDGDTMNL